MHKDSLVLFFVLTFAITWGIGAFAIFLPVQFQAVFGELADTNPIYYLAVAALTISATIITLAREGRAGLKALYSRLIRWRFGIQWYTLVLVGIPVVGWLVSRFSGSTPLKPTNSIGQLLLLLVYLLSTGPLLEELGWRGFALPRLLKGFNPFVASLILGFIWGLWHLPSFFLSGMVQAKLSLFAFILWTPCFAILITWVFQHTGGSVLITVLIHYMVNISASILGVTLPALGIVMLVASILVLALDKDMNWFGKEKQWTHASQLPPIPPALPLT
jgi:membrane protease YdiL (CAAX protease family)